MKKIFIMFFCCFMFFSVIFFTGCKLSEKEPAEPPHETSAFSEEERAACWARYVDEIRNAGTVLGSDMYEIRFSESEEGCTVCGEGVYDSYIGTLYTYWKADSGAIEVAESLVISSPILAVDDAILVGESIIDAFHEKDYAHAYDLTSIRHTIDSNIWYFGYSMRPKGDEVIFGYIFSITVDGNTGEILQITHG